MAAKKEKAKPKKKTPKKLPGSALTGVGREKPKKRRAS
jgi:hypothetical protein